MTLRITPFTRPRPVLPAHLRRTDRIIGSLDRIIMAAAAGASSEPGSLAQLADALAGALLNRTPEELADEARYDAEVAAYNAAAGAHNAQVRARRQARANAAEVAALRAAACPRCMSTHPGEC